MTIYYIYQWKVCSIDSAKPSSRLDFVTNRDLICECSDINHGTRKSITHES